MMKLIVVFDLDPSWEQFVLEKLDEAFNKTNAEYKIFTELEED